MIEPNMATMLAFISTDAQVAPAMLQRALVESARDTFNAITVDGECSTNDSLFAMASAAAGCPSTRSCIRRCSTGCCRVASARARDRPRRRGCDE
jgi:N-acetylglutamate synthase/N-acetylornithine aminotransferase